MRLKAIVRANTGKTIHKAGFVLPDGTIKGDVLPQAYWVEIVEDEGGTYLYRYDSNDTFITDTWHVSVEDAKQQAKFEYNIDETDWHKSI